MNKDNAKDYLPLVQALAEGKTIQYSRHWLRSVTWGDLCDPHFDMPPNYYRVKPEPRKVTVQLWKNDATGLISPYLGDMQPYLGWTLLGEHTFEIGEE